jgi:hypothetical protein
MVSRGSVVKILEKSHTGLIKLELSQLSIKVEFAIQL